MTFSILYIYLVVFFSLLKTKWWLCRACSL